MYSEVIAVNQDWSGKGPGTLVESHNTTRRPNYLWAVPCTDAQVAAQAGWELRPVAGAPPSTVPLGKVVQVAASGGRGCVDTDIQSPLSLRPCEAHPVVGESTQALVYDEKSGHLGMHHPTEEGKMYGYINIAGGDKASKLVGGRGVNLQLTHSYGPDQPNEEYSFVNGTFRDRCVPGRGQCGQHSVRCVVANTSVPSVGNNAENLVQNISWQIWAKPLSGGAVAALVLNRDEDHLSAKINFAKVGIDVGAAKGGVRVRDLHAKKDIGVVKESEWTAPTIGRHDSVMLKLTPLYDLDWAAGGHGSMKSDDIVIAPRTPRIDILSADQGGCWRIPVLVAAGDRLLAFAAHRWDHASGTCADNGLKAIVVRASSDGQVWGPLRTIANNSLPSSFPKNDGYSFGSAVFDSHARTVFVTFVTCSHGAYPSCPPTVWMSESRTLGETWSPPRNITPQVGQLFWGPTSTGLQLPSGRLLLCGSHRVAPKYSRTPPVPSSDLVLVSDSHGSSWRTAGTTNYTHHPDMQPNECQLALLSNGSILLNARDVGKGGESGPERHRLLARSDDNGESFSAPWVEPALLDSSCEGSIIRVGGCLVTSNLFGHGRSNLSLSLSCTEGASWRGGVLSVAPTGGSGYSSMAMLPWDPSGRSFGMLYEHGNGSLYGPTSALRPYEHIGFRTFSMHAKPHLPLKLDDEVVCVDWCAKPLARTAAVHSLHDVSAGATGNPWHDSIYPPSVYDIVDEINLRRTELGAPLDRLWWAAGVQWDWPANSSTPTLHADPEPTPPNFTSHRAHWDLRALDVKVLNLQKSVAFPDTTILQLQGPQAYLLADPTGVRLGEHFSRVLDWYSRGGFTDEFGRYHHSGYNISFGYLEVLNEIDINPHFAYGGPLNATRRYIKLFDGVATVVKQRHPSIKFVGNCLSGRGDGDNGIVWRTFLNRSEHAAGVPWPIDAVSYHLYTGRASDGAPFNEWPAGLVQNARNVLPSAKTVTSLIKQLSPTTQVFVDEIGLFFTEPVREAMNFETMRGDGLNTSFWNLQSAIYSMWAGELAAVGVDMFGASQLLGYPAGPPGTPVGAPAGNPAAGTPFQPQVTPDGNCPVCISLFALFPRPAAVPLASLRGACGCRK